MAIRTVLTEEFGLEYPIVSAPMALVSGGGLAAAVSEAGGLGLVGGGYGDPEWLRRELSAVETETRRPWGVGLITWRAGREAVDLALGYRPRAFMLSFGDPTPYASAIKEAGCALICQVQDLRGARVAQAAGADYIVAQGTEAGGHGADNRSTLPLVPAVVDAVSPTPVLAAGGIADGRGLAAALALGAQGALVGTRFYASAEALGHRRAKEMLVEGEGDRTKRTSVFDVVRGISYPDSLTGRALLNPFFERWEGREEELAAALETEAPDFKLALRDGDFGTAMVWSGEGVDLISDVPPAADLVRRIGAEAEACLRAAHGLLNASGRDREATRMRQTSA
jgi:nitronate monooxygenase